MNKLFSAFLPKMIYFTLTEDGRASGECFCQLNSLEEWNKAMELDKKEMGNRYIDGKRHCKGRNAIAHFEITIVEFKSFETKNNPVYRTRLNRSGRIFIPECAVR